MSLSRMWAAAGRKGLLVVILFSILLTGGCAQATPTPQPVTIRFACWEGDEHYYRVLADSFAEEQPVRVELVPTSSTDLSALTGDSADVLFGADIPTRQAQGDIIPLDSLIAGDPTFDRTDYYPGTLATYTIGGQLWALPAWLDAYVMYYNKDIFDTCEAPYPTSGWTWDDFLSTAMGITDPEGEHLSYIYGWPAVDPILCMLAHGGQLWEGGQEATHLTLDNPRNVEALEWFARLASQSRVTLTPEEAAQILAGPSAPKNNAVWAGIVGLWMGGFSERGGRLSGGDERWPMAWGMTTVPRDAQAVTLAHSTTLAISAKAQDPEACFAWLAYLSRQLPKDGIPARRSLLESDRFEKAVGSEAAAIARTTLENWVAFGQSYPPAYLAAVGIFDQAMQDVLNGQVSAEEGLTRAQQEAEALQQ